MSHPRANRSPTVVLVPGWGNSSYEHWQSVWQRRRNDCVRADLGNWFEPKPIRWISRLDSTIRAQGPVVIVAHSLGCIATAMWAERLCQPSQVIGALLVAPCDTQQADACDALRRFARVVPSSKLPFRSIVVASENDHYAALERSQEFAADWGAAFVNAGRMGHLNAESDLGDWFYGQALLNDLLNPAPTAPMIAPHPPEFAIPGDLR